MAPSSPLNFDFPGTIGLPECEEIIEAAGTLHRSASPIVRVSSNYKSTIFGDLWVTMALGTIFRVAPESRAVVWGLSDNHKFNAARFSTSLPGLASTFMAVRLLRDQSHAELEVSEVRQWIERDQNGYVSDIRGADRTIIELDSTRSSSLKDLTASGAEIDEKAFLNLFLQIRQELEVWAIGNDQRQDINKSEMRDIAVFLKELFENSYKHGRLGESLLQRMIPQLRFLRVRKIVEPNRDRLLCRTENSIPLIREYVEAVMEGTKENALIEVCVSDFGQGILDYFLASPTGRRVSRGSRQSTFERLLYENLTSESHDPQAGLGLPNALSASRRLRAFVSLRTAEFWYARSFADQPTDYYLNRVYDGPRGKVVGTHWQFLLPPPD